MAVLSPPPKLQFFDANGVPLVGGKLYSYAAGTTTPLATYTSAAETTFNTNPIILNSRGEAEVWLGSPLYKFKLTTAADVEIWTVDNITSLSGLQATIDASIKAYYAATAGASRVGFIRAEAGAGARTAEDKLRDVVSVKDFGAVGNGVADDTAAVQAAISAVSALGGTVVFPNGEYKVTAPTTLSANQIWLKGDLNARIKRYGAFEIFNVTGSYNKISDLQLMGNKASYPFPANSRAAIVIVQGDFNIASDCQIEEGNSHGILFRTGGAPQFNLAQGNIVLNCDEVGIAHDGGVDNRILGNHVSGCGFEGVTLDQSSLRCIVDGNRLNANCQVGGVGSIGIDWTDLCVVSNNVITGTGAGLSGITFQNNLGPSNFNVITGNVFDVNAAYGVHMKTNAGGSCSDNVVSGNMFRTSGSIKIESGCQRNTLSGNVYAAFPDIHTDSYNRIDNALVNFYAQNTTTRTNVTGDGTAYVVPYNNLVQDRNITSTGSYNASTGVFTAPVTANYTFSGGVLLTSGTGTADSLVVEIITSSGAFAQTFSSLNQAAFGASITASFFLKRGETARIQATVSGGAKDYSVTNNTNANFFACVLVG